MLCSAIQAIIAFDDPNNFNPAVLPRIVWSIISRAAEARTYIRPDETIDWNWKKVGAPLHEAANSAIADARGRQAEGGPAGERPLEGVPPAFLEAVDALGRFKVRYSDERAA